MTTLLECLDVALSTRWQHARAQEALYRTAKAAIDEIGVERVQDVTVTRLRAAQRAWQAEGLSPATCNRRLAALSSCLAAAREEGAIADVPRFPRRLPEPPGRERAPTRDELAAIMRAMRSVRSCEARLVRLLAATGCRLAEGLALRPFDLERDPGGTWWLRVRTSKSGKPRMVPLPARLSRWAERSVRRGDDPLFAQVARSSFGRVWREARESAGLGGWFVPHTLRHMRASTLAASGAPVPTVAALLGHADWRTTARYTHVARDQVAAAVSAAEVR